MTVAILAFPEATASVVHGLYDLFLCAGRDWGYIVDGAPGESLLQPRIVSRAGTPLRVANGVPVVPEARMDEVGTPDIVFVPEVFLPPTEPMGDRFAAEVAWLHACHARGAIVASACSGALLLAESGLLDGCEATIHWAYERALAARYPRVSVRAQRALVITGEGHRLVMAGGGTSWMDLALYLMARTVGIDIAMQVARLNLIDWHATGQQPFARLARTRQVEDAVIARCQAWIAENYGHPAPVAAMVRLSGMAERSFQRRFKLATGMAPLECVHTLRLEEAKQLLECDDAPVEAIAEEIGYADLSFFGRLFRRKVGLTPARYRRRFGALRTLLQTEDPAAVRAQTAERRRADLAAGPSSASGVPMGADTRAAKISDRQAPESCSG